MDYTFWGMLLSSIVGFVVGVGVGAAMKSGPEPELPPLQTLPQAEVIAQWEQEIDEIMQSAWRQGW